MVLNQAIKTIRKELIIKDEPLKAWKLLNLFPELKPQLKEEWKNTYGMVRHMFDLAEYQKACDIPTDDAEDIEAKEFITNAGARYDRYQWVLNHLLKTKPKTYLDLGCYVGSMVTTAASKGIESTGVDLTPSVIKIAKKRAKEANLTNCKFFVANVEKFEPRVSRAGIKKYDAVSSMEVLEHVVDPDKYVKHMLSLSNGWCYISTPDGPYGDGEGNIKQGWEWDGKGVRGHVRVFIKETLTPILDKYNCEYEFGNLNDGLLNVRFKEAI